jgi:hypothetical protein
VGDVLQHPLFVLAVGSVITGFLVPRYARLRERAQREFSMRTGLIEEITRELTDFVMAVQFAELGGISQDDLSSAYRRWKVFAAATATRVDIYFAEPRLAEEWGVLSHRAERFYALAGIGGDDRDAELRRLLAEADLSAEGPFQEGWLRLRNALLDLSRGFGAALLTTPVRRFG